MNRNSLLRAQRFTDDGSSILLGGTWNVVAIADFDRNGSPDFLVQTEDMYIGIWHFDGTERINCQYLSLNNSGGYPGKWRAVGTGDFNFDGKVDILFQWDYLVSPPHLDDGMMVAWLMDDINYCGWRWLWLGLSHKPSDSKLRVVATGDFYRQCKTDIVFQRKDPRTGWGGELSIWEMNAGSLAYPEANLTSKAEHLISGVSVDSRNVVGPR